MEADNKGRLSIMVPVEMLEEIDNWRRSQPRIPSLAAASRLLLQAGLIKLGDATKQKERKNAR